MSASTASVVGGGSAFNRMARGATFKFLQLAAVAKFSPQHLVGCRPTRCWPSGSCSRRRACRFPLEEREREQELREREAKRKWRRQGNGLAWNGGGHRWRGIDRGVGAVAGIYGRRGRRSMVAAASSGQAAARASEGPGEG